MEKMQGHSKGGRVAELLFLLVLALYPLRHINQGIDFWDTGYNYANFQYMGLEHMDSMWLFSTYLANAAGRFLTVLPFGDSLLGMNFYTGIFVSALAIGGYLFCTRKLAIPSWLTFLGEIAAVSLCWCPTALLYNYLTYVFFLICVVLLYKGLTEGRNRCLYAAGLCLGINVSVRFSNLPEAALIVAVWAYGVIEALEDAAQRKTGAGVFVRTVKRTLRCLGGYLTAIFLWLFYIQIRYGLDAYAEGIKRLFAMTDNAPDYKATAMLMGMFDMYLENLYWLVRILFIVAVGMVLFAVGRFVTGKILRKNRKVGDKAAHVFEITAKGVWCMVCLAMLGWLYYRGFCSLEFYAYGSMLRPGVLFLMLTIGIAALRIFSPKSPKEEKLISGLLILVVLLTSIGSNNKLFPSLNNLFLAAPYTLWQSERFIRYAGDGKGKLVFISFFPAKGVLAAFLALFFAQSFLFGANFVFAEATGVQNATAQVENNEILKGIRMHPERARWLGEISAFVSEQGLEGQDVILYGQLPSVTYYLQMPAAFNPWSELDSYSLETMEADMGKIREKMQADVSYRPVLILENQYILYWEKGREALEAAGIEEKQIQKVQSLMENGKWRLIEDFVQDYGYQNTFRNEKFGIWQ
ncbi:MAG: hypothetical protein NC094_11535 [Bacteroidales bacterium]|nr:hypothetical protein [Lachnoclostridium sp.]MCM1385073.1 hypothetical protein [Lachnoclostridium sp.]MCM1466040.1 hypothetical protein [Bacteroidales bacterium]